MNYAISPPRANEAIDKVDQSECSLPGKIAAIAGIIERIRSRSSYETAGAAAEIYPELAIT